MTLKVICAACGKDDWNFLLDSCDFNGEGQKTYECNNCGHVVLIKDLTKTGKHE